MIHCIDILLPEHFMDFEILPEGSITFYKEHYFKVRNTMVLLIQND